jgi:hypothetical protein
MTRLDTRTWPDHDQERPVDHQPSEVWLTVRFLLVPVVATAVFIGGLIYGAITLRGGLENLEEATLREEAALVTKVIADHVEDEGSLPDDLTLTGRFVTLDGEPTVLDLDPAHSINHYDTDDGEYSFCLVGRAGLWSAYDSRTDEVTSGPDFRACA